MKLWSEEIEVSVFFASCLYKISLRPLVRVASPAMFISVMFWELPEKSTRRPVMPAWKPSPVMVTVWPPAAGPLVLSSEATENWNSRALLKLSSGLVNVDGVPVGSRPLQSGF